jgi:undecaprenyl-diphosphatase
MNIDLIISQFLNQMLVGHSPLIDQLIESTQSHFLTTAVLVAALWWLWFKYPSPESRSRLVIGMLAVLVAVSIARTLQLTLPIHVRPLFNPDLHLKTVNSILPEGLHHWSSAPSDSATYLFALVAVAWFQHRKLGLLSLIPAVVMCVGRVISGIHYASDVLEGAVLGVSIVAMSQLVPVPNVVRRLPFNSPLLIAFLFLASFEIASYLIDVQNVLGHVLRVTPN